MESSGTMALVFLRVFARALADKGVGEAELLGALGAAPDELADPDARIPAERVLGLLEHATRLTGDEDFGLHFAESVPFGAFAVLDHVVGSSRTVREGLERTARYYALVHDRVKLDLFVEGSVARFTHQMLAPLPVPRHAVEALFASVVARGRTLTGRSWPLRAVCFVHPEPARTTEHARIFRAPVRFRQPIDEIVFDAGWLDQPLASQDVALSEVLERYAKDLLARLPRESDFVVEVRRAILRSLRGRDASLEGTAGALGTSPRTLQRKLKGLGTSHQALADDVRRELATRYLGGDDLAIGEVAYLLGFADTSTFHRAFKKWTGSTPAEFRRRAR